MARRLRSNLPNGIYHVTTRGVARAMIFMDDDDRRRFLRLLAEIIESHGWLCHAFCLMGNHYHLIVETTCERLSAGLHRLNGVYAQEFNRRHGRCGHLFGDRFASWVIDGEAHFEAACRYLLANPVRAGLCEDERDWPWSACRSDTRR